MADQQSNNDKAYPTDKDQDMVSAAYRASKNGEESGENAVPDVPSSHIDQLILKNAAFKADEIRQQKSKENKTPLQVYALVASLFVAILAVLVVVRPMEQGLDLDSLEMSDMNTLDTVSTIESSGQQAAATAAETSLNQDAQRFRAAAPAVQSPQLEEIVVTGSRVASDDLQAERLSSAALRSSDAEELVMEKQMRLEEVFYYQEEAEFEKSLFEEEYPEIDLDVILAEEYRVYPDEWIEVILELQAEGSPQAEEEKALFQTVYPELDLDVLLDEAEG